MATASAALKPAEFRPTLRGRFAPWGRMEPARDVLSFPSSDRFALPLRGRAGHPERAGRQRGADRPATDHLVIRAVGPESRPGGGQHLH